MRERKENRYGIGKNVILIFFSSNWGKGRRFIEYIRGVNSFNAADSFDAALPPGFSFPSYYIKKDTF